MRIFLAYPLPEDVKNVVRKIISDLGAVFPELPVLWTHKDNMHITTEFLGEIDNTELEVLRGTIQQEVSNLPSFEFSLGKLEAFPNISQPRVLVAQVVERGGGVSADFRNKLHKKLLERKITKENKPWKPHITLGRLKKPSKLNVEYFGNYKTENISWKVERVDLFDSTLSRNGAVYKIINSYSLK